jgi:hypothetical protein
MGEHEGGPPTVGEGLEADPSLPVLVMSRAPLFSNDKAGYLNGR